MGFKAAWDSVSWCVRWISFKFNGKGAPPRKGSPSPPQTHTRTLTLAHAHSPTPPTQEARTEMDPRRCQLYVIRLSSVFFKIYFNFSVLSKFSKIVTEKIFFP